MRNKSEQYQQVLDNIAAGDPMAAYTGFTQLPFSEQMMLYMTPGVGDAIAYVESADFFDKAGTAREEGRYGDMIGSGLSGGIAAASMLPFAGSVVDAARVGGKTLERGIGSLMNRVNARMDDGIPGGGGGSRGGGSNTTNFLDKQKQVYDAIASNKELAQSTDLVNMPKEFLATTGFKLPRITKTTDNSFEINANYGKNFENSREGQKIQDKIQMDFFEKNGLKRNDLLNIEEDGGSYLLSRMDIDSHFDLNASNADPGSVKLYRILDKGEDTGEYVETFKIDGVPVVEYGSSDAMGSYTLKTIPKKEALLGGGVNDKRRSQLLFDLKRERMIQQKSVNDLVEMEGSKKAEAKIIAELKKLDAAG